MTPEDYLAFEERSEVRHEFLNGVIYAMAGARNRHSRIVLNIGSLLHAQLRGKQCSAFVADTRVRIRAGDDRRFYYPDAGVTCRPNPLDDVFEDEPAVVFEVLSESTRRADTGEKRDGYFKIESLQRYVLVEPEMAALTIYQRTPDGWRGEVIDDIAGVLRLPEIECELPLSEIYAGVLG